MKSFTVYWAFEIDALTAEDAAWYARHEMNRARAEQSLDVFDEQGERETFRLDLKESV